MSVLSNLVDEVEEALASIYHFDIMSSAKDFLVTEAFMQAHSQAHRAAVMLRQNLRQDELEIGVYFHPDLIARMAEIDPACGLSQDNLDVFCVLVEEISHFHLLTNRARCGKTVSRLELEWQGEIDKVLIAGYWLLRQTGSPCFRQLTHLIFDRSEAVGFAEQLYDEALRYAAQHWNQVWHEVKGQGAQQQCKHASQKFRNSYKLPWMEKLKLFEKR